MPQPKVFLLAGDVDGDKAATAFAKDLMAAAEQMLEPVGRVHDHQGPGKGAGSLECLDAGVRLLRQKAEIMKGEAVERTHRDGGGQRARSGDDLDLSIQLLC